MTRVSYFPICSTWLALQLWQNYTYTMIQNSDGIAASVHGTHKHFVQYENKLAFGFGDKVSFTFLYSHCLSRYQFLYSVIPFSLRILASRPSANLFFVHIQCFFFYFLLFPIFFSFGLKTQRCYF